MENLFDKIKPPIKLKTQRLTVEDITKKDALEYQRLYLDDDLNKWWGYDYREDLGDKEPTKEYFLRFQQSLKDKKEEYSLAVKKDGVMVGELVLHNFDESGGVEIGFRFFKECHGKGYALESATALKDYAITTLGASTLKSRCYKENAPSRKLIERLGLKLSNQSDTHYFFALAVK
jgi:ribosomal-protein-alanine N-acetyltransferase